MEVRWGGNAKGVAGRSFASVLCGESDTHRGAIITGYYAAGDRWVRAGRGSGSTHPGEEPDELFDRRSDLGERQHLIDPPPPEARRLASGLYSQTGVCTPVTGPWEYPPIT